MAERPQPRRDADVIVDVELEDGLLFLSVANLGDLPAHRVRVRFDPPLTGLGGRKRIDRLALFRRLELLAPHKRIRTILDRRGPPRARRADALRGESDLAHRRRCPLRAHRRRRPLDLPRPRHPRPLGA